ncbi:tetratricopeptide repeat protein [Chondrinema litorale]|uniref:tetratricopeptide repeat protein n=1 Tax=Chondrinema litorale TaxID=2994555 RepID=UPI002542AC14|nr:tetratricopeptide repeat protein [Chondrinema litorale]UZR93505.1 tetratricopeptide repeat protein [Chondrinema litorale]
MNAFQQRAEFLIKREKYTEAESEIRKEIAINPENDIAYFYLAECQLAQNKTTEAKTTIEKAIGINPDKPYNYLTLSRIYLHMGNLKEAEYAIDEAIKIYPYQADFFLIKGNIYFAKHQWEKALEYAEIGLRAEPDHISCLNLRTMALMKLNRKEEAAATVDFALKNAPENVLSHVNKGWTEIEAGNHDKAQGHFKEALRINPNSIPAKEGLKESIKAKNFLYRSILNYFLWTSKLSKRNQWILIIGLYLAYKFIGRIAAENPSIAPFLYPLMLVYLLFVFSTWIASPLSDLFLRLHPLGKYALDNDEKTASNLVGGFLVVCIICVGAYFATNLSALLLGGIWSGLMLIPVGGTFQAPRNSKGRKYLIAVTSAIGIAGLLGIFVPALAGMLIPAFLIGIFLYGWIANYLIMK